MLFKPGASFNSVRELKGCCFLPGSGKSTLMLAMFRLAEASSGRISVDGIDVSTLDLGLLRRKVSIFHYCTSFQICSCGS